MDVTSTTTASPATKTTATKPTPSNYDTFLRMLTAQIKNQDPLNPMSSDNFAVQLATFSGVEQQTKTNDLLAKQLEQNANGSLMQMVGWVGKEARIAAPTYFDGENPVTLSPNPAINAKKALLIVKTPAGLEVSRTEIPVTSADYEWQGLDPTGKPLPKGVYNLTLESYKDDEKLGATEVEYFAQVNEIRSSPSGVTALFAGGVEVSTALITALREP